MSDVSRVEDVFLAAAGLADPAERAAYLDEVCGADIGLRRRVEVLLAAQPNLGRFLEPPDDRTHAYLPGTVAPATAAGRVIAGKYKLVQEIGAGGMGTVWVAQQTEPVQRIVAVKLIRAGMDSRSVLVRFEAERQALALMDHPNIARVLDGGVADDGRPYFVMELVKGVPITRFCDERRLTPRQRLELFVPVCQAIQHAHQKGIIHRDIKPSNVLIALYDDRPVPKVIDFGIAKATGPTLTDKTLMTEFGSVVGTPEYMSPEQASLNNLDIDTRTDVYSLGVLLYELLVGSPPFQSEALQKAGVLEMLRVVCEEEPPRPSQKLSTANTLPSISANRGTEPKTLTGLLRNELDWIVMRSLEKDRNRRYETVNGLAADVQRYLAGEPVQAHPPTLGYRLHKAYRRHRPVVLAGGAFVFLLASAVVVSGWLAARARQAQVEARRAQAVADRNAAAFSGAMVQADTALQAVERTTSDHQVDAALLDFPVDPRVGLLRLARTLRTLAPTDGRRRYPTEGGGEIVLQESPANASARERLRGFVTAAVIAAGQEFVPLVPVPPATRLYDSLSPDHRLCLGGDERSGLKLLAIPSLAPLGVLREGTERVTASGYSPDGQTVYTQDSDSVVRFWNRDGTLRARTPLRPERFRYPAGLTKSDVSSLARKTNPVLVAEGVAVLWTTPRVGVTPSRGNEQWQGEPGRKGPVDLYSARTGQFLRRLNRPGWEVSDWAVSPDGRWLVAVERPESDPEDRRPGAGVAAAVILSADDGRELARLEHPPGAGQHLSVRVSPTGKWVITLATGSLWDRQPPSVEHVRLWSSTTWQPVRDRALEAALRQQEWLVLPAFLTDDVIELWDPSGPEGTWVGVCHLGRPGLWASPADLGFRGPEWDRPVSELGGTRLRCGTTLTDAATLTRLQPPTGRKCHPDLARIAPDGRFWRGFDTVTEKTLLQGDSRGIAGFGSVWVRLYLHESDGLRGNDDPELRLLPDPERLDSIPPPLVELWAQVVVGGELGADDRFQPWDERTWAAKQRELAAAKPPVADFPFPGWAAAEPNLWYRIRANAAKDISDRNRLVEEFLRRTGRMPLDPGPDPWRTPEAAEPEPDAVTPPHAVSSRP